MENGYTYDSFSPPVIREVYPNKGPIDGGTEVVIRGNYFLEEVTVIIGGIQIEHLDSLSPIEIRLKTPPSPPGRTEIRVWSTPMVNKLCKNTDLPTMRLSILPVLPPMWDSMEGGTLVTITGTGFHPIARSTQVTIDGIPASTIIDMSLTRVIIKTPAAKTPGTKEVALRNPNGEEVTAYRRVYL